MTSKTPLDKAIDFIMEFDGEDEVCKILPALKAAKRDKARLDWLIEYHLTTRRALDKAMRKTK